MKNLVIVISAIFWSLGSFCYGQSGSNISNIQWEVDQEKEVITITYNLEKIQHYSHFDISLVALLDGQQIVPRSTQGDVGIGKYIEAGASKKIVWHYFEDVPTLKGKLEFFITAISEVISDPDSDNDGIPDSADRCPYEKGSLSRQGCPPKGVPAWAGLAGIGGTGITLLTSGLLKQSEAVEVYNTEYQSLRNPNSEDFDLEAAGFLKDQLKKDYKNGQWLAIGGGVVLAAGSALLIKRLIKDKKRKNKTTSIDLYPMIDPAFKTNRNKRGGSVGIGMSINF